MKRQFKDIFPKKHSIIGMIHLQALPGTPGSQFEMEEIIEMALTDAAVSRIAGCPTILPSLQFCHYGTGAGVTVNQLT